MGTRAHSAGAGSNQYAVKDTSTKTRADLQDAKKAADAPNGDVEYAAAVFAPNSDTAWQWAFPDPDDREFWRAWGTVDALEARRWEGLCSRNDTTEWWANGITNIADAERWMDSAVEPRFGLEAACSWKQIGVTDPVVALALIETAAQKVDFHGELDFRRYPHPWTHSKISAFVDAHGRLPNPDRGCPAYLDPTPTRLLMQDHGVYTAHDDRFHVTRSSRRPRRGPSDSVTDGWLLQDAVSGAQRWVATLAEARTKIDQDLIGERTAVAYSQYATVPSWQPPKHGQVLTEVYLTLTDDSGHPPGRVRAGIVGSDQVESNAAYLLAHLGYSDIVALLACPDGVPDPESRV